MGESFLLSTITFYFDPSDDLERPCTPTDFLNVTNYFDNNNFNNVVGGENTVCLPLCLRTEYVMKITEGKIDEDAAAKYSVVTRQPQQDIDPK